MIRPTWMWIAVSLVAVTAGCRMCASTHDYCGPVLDGAGGCQGQYGCESRAGSILSGMPGPMIDSSMQPTMHPSMAGSVIEPQYESNYTLTNSAGVVVGTVPEFGVDPKMILSVTDRKVDESPATQAIPVKTSGEAL